MKVSEIEAPSAIHALLFGPPKSGKTRLLGELAEHGFIIDFLDLENGGHTLRSSLSDEAKERVNLIRIPDTREWPVAIETCLKLSKLWGNLELAKPTRICIQHGKVECPMCTKNPLTQHNVIDFSKYTNKHILAIDGMTQLSTSSINQITKNWADFEDGKKLGWDEYGAQGRHLGLFLGRVQNAPIHIILTSHEMGIEQEDGAEKIQPVGGTKNFARQVPKFFDEVIYMRIFNRRHQAVSETTEIKDVMAGSRSDIQLSKQEKPSLVEIFTGEKKVVTQVQQAVANLKGMTKTP